MYQYGPLLSFARKKIAYRWIDFLRSTGALLHGPEQIAALLHGPEQIADLPVPVAESPGAVRIGHPERSHLVEYLAPNSVFNSLPRQRSSPRYNQKLWIAKLRKAAYPST